MKATGLNTRVRAAMLLLTMILISQVDRAQDSTLAAKPFALFPSRGRL